MRWLKTIRSRSRLVALADQVVFSGTSFVTTFGMAHLLTPAAFGIFSGFTLVSYLLIALCNALVVQPFQVSYPQAADQPAYRTFVLYLQLLLVAVVGGGGASLAYMPTGALGEFQPYVIPATGMMAALLLHDFFRKTLLAQNKVSQALVIDLLMSVLQLSGLALAFYLSLRDLVSLLWISAVSFGAPAIYGLVIYGARRGAAGWKVYARSQLGQAKWLLATAVIQWWSGNLFVVAAGIFLGPVALGAFRLVQSLFGVLNMLLQTYENYALPEAVRRFQHSPLESKAYLRSLSVQGALWFGLVVIPLFLFPGAIMRVTGGEAYVPYAFVIRGMALLYLIIIIGYPVRMAVRMLVVNHIFFMGYVLTFLFSIATVDVLLKTWQLQGAMVGLIANQLILIVFWNYGLAKKQFLLWR